MSDFATVAESLLGWPSRRDSAEGGTARRLLSAMANLAANSAPVGPGDLAGLVSQVLREQAAKTPNEQVRLRVPRADGWPTRVVWEEHGARVTVESAAWFLVQPQEWHPKWLPGADVSSPGLSALRGDRRRSTAHVAADPVWRDLLDQETYLSAGQRDAVRGALLLEPGGTLLVVLPTGGGKSFVAQAPALLSAQEGGTTLLIVPTVALALDQERRAVEMFGGRPGFGGLRNFAYHGGLCAEEKSALRQRIRDGAQPLVIASPEAVVQGLRPALIACAHQGGLRSIVIDEAHLVSQWGNEFRPEFQALSGIRRLLVEASPANSAPRTILLTATLTTDAWRTLRALFGTPELRLVAAVHLRPEPTYWLVKAADATARDAWLLEAVRFAPRPLILYTALRCESERIAQLLRVRGLRRLGLIHGETSAADRGRLVEAWSSGGVDVMVATSAFGLGMDQSDVRTVIHACIPETLDRYYQEVGRAGRDGRACLAILIAEPRDLDVARSLNAERIIGIEKGLVRWRQMYNTARRESGSGSLVVSLDARPPAVQGDSKANVAWNLRTLILMARAGLIELGATEPPPPADDADPQAVERGRLAFEEYTRSVAVRPTGLAHLDEDTWHVRVEPVRKESLAGDRRSLAQVERLLSGTDRISDLLVEAYTVEAGGVRIVPNSVGGCCAVDRARGVLPSGYTHPDPVSTIAVRSEIRPPLEEFLRAAPSPAVVFVPSVGPAALRAWREDLLPVLKRLVTLGVREIRAPQGWLELPGYRALYRVAQPRIVFHTDWNHDPPGLAEGDGVARITIAEDGVGLHDLMVEATGSRRGVDLLFVPRGTADPARTDRLIDSVLPSISLPRLILELD